MPQTKFPSGEARIPSPEKQSNGVSRREPPFDEGPELCSVQRVCGGGGGVTGIAMGGAAFGGKTPDPAPDVP